MPAPLSWTDPSDRIRAVFGLDQQLAASPTPAQFLRQFPEPLRHPIRLLAQNRGKATPVDRV